MNSFLLRHATPADASEVAALVIAVEVALVGSSTFSLDDLVEEWRELDLERMAWIVDGERIVGYGSLQDRGDLWRATAYVHPDAVGRGVGTLLVQTLEHEATARGARRVQNDVLEVDEKAHALLRGLGYREVRRFREMRIELSEPPARAEWPDEIRADAFDPGRDEHAVHAAHQEAFADAWEYTPRPFDVWRTGHIEGPKFDPSLWCVARDGDEIAGGMVCVPSMYGGGWVSVLFTRRPWRRRGLGAALLADAFGRFWERDIRSVGLSVDAESGTGAFRLYECAGMRVHWGAAVFERSLGG